MPTRNHDFSASERGEKGQKLSVYASFQIMKDINLKLNL